MAETAFSSRRTSALTGITPRQLSYWRDTGLLSPAQSSAGGHARYSFTDLVILKAIKKLLDSGVSLQRIRKTAHALQQLLPSIETPLSEVTLVASGDVVLVFRNNTVFDAVSGQEWILPVAQLQREIAASGAPPQGAQIELFPDDDKIREEKQHVLL